MEDSKHIPGYIEKYDERMCVDRTNCQNAIIMQLLKSHVETLLQTYFMIIIS